MAEVGVEGQGTPGSPGEWAVGVPVGGWGGAG